MTLTQVSKREGRIEKVPIGETPVLDLHLAPGEYVINVELVDMRYLIARDRKTTDWRWTAYIATPLAAATPRRRRAA